MEKPISVGDLVVVVKPAPCCGVGKRIGLHFIVAQVEQPDIGRCWHCNNQHLGWEIYSGDPTKGWFHISRLKRIPPPEELGLVTEDEEIEA